MAEPERDFDPDALEPMTRDAGQLFLLTIESKPTADSDDFGEAAGAFVSCWINEDDLPRAAQKAIDLIIADGWLPLRLDAWELVSRETYQDREQDEADGEDDLDYEGLVEEAFREGGTLVFHAWRAGEE